MTQPGTPSAAIYVKVFNEVQSLRINEKTFEICGLNQVIDICVAINHLIKGKTRSLQLNCY